MNDAQEMKALADSLGEYIKSKYIEPTLKNAVRYFRAQVTSPAINGKISVRRPFDDTDLSLPYVSSASGLHTGDQCLVAVFGSLSNAVILGDGTLSNL